MTKEFFEEHKKHGKQIEELAAQLELLKKKMEEMLERLDNDGK